MKNAFSMLKTSPQQNNSEVDDCDRYGKILASKLRKLSEEKRLQVTYRIDGLFLKKLRNNVEMKEYVE